MGGGTEEVARRLALAAGIALILGGCGADDPEQHGAAYIEYRLPIIYAKRGIGEMRSVACVKRTDRVFRCAATVVPSEQFARRQAGVDASRVTVARIRRELTEHISLEVTIDPDTGKFVTRLLS